MKKKNLAARRIAELSFQFYRDKEGTPNFMITCNPEAEGRDFCTGIDAYMFARNLIESPLVSFNELVFLCDFFDKVRSEMQKRFGVREPKP